MMKELLVKEYDVGVAGSLTMIVLFSSVALLLRSFYKRFKRFQDNPAPLQKSEDSD